MKSHGIVKKCHKNVNVYVMKSHEIVTKKSHGNVNLCNTKSLHSEKSHKNVNLCDKNHGIVKKVTKI